MAVVLAGDGVETAMQNGVQWRWCRHNDVEWSAMALVV